MTLTLLLATVLSGLSAGLFAAFSYAVMPGLRRADDRSLVAAMRGINIAILNPVFLVVFLGPLLAGVAALVVAVTSEGPLVPVASGVVLYLATLVITMTVSVPLNVALEAQGDGDVSAARQGFEARWVRWNHARAATSVAAFVAFAVGLAG